MSSRGWYLVGLVDAMFGLRGAALYFSFRFVVVDEGVIRMVAPGETVIRNLFRFIDGLLLYLVCFSRKLQGIDDIVAGTVVIRHR
jgi:hypothetical protein